MKKVILLVGAVMLTFAVSQAQTVQEQKLKSEIKSLDKKDTNEKQEKKVLRKELHKLKSQEVSEQSKSQFIKDFKGITNAKWKKSDSFDQASFMKKGDAMAAFYDQDSKLIGTTTIKKYSDLPVNAQNKINEKYKEYSKGSVIYYDDNEENVTNMLFYGKPFDKDNYFLEILKNGKKSVLQITTEGEVIYFESMK